MHDANRRQAPDHARSADLQSVARCPKCNTAFHITPEQRQQAEGRVRCGVCLHVFDADAASVARKADEHVSSPRADGSNWFERSHKASATKALAIEPADESWALALLSELEEGIKQALPVEAPVASLAPCSHPASVGARAAYEKTVTSAQIGWAPTPSVPAREIVAPSRKPSFQSDGLAQQNARRTRDMVSDSSPRARRFPWFMANSLLIVASLGVLSWHYWPVLVHHPPFFLAAEWVCRFAGCEVPARRDWSALSLSFKVRRHPEQANRLEASALLTNHAAFAQPLPWLSLEFSDIHGANVDTLRFAPEDYLKGDMLSQTHLPANQSVQIVLVLPDPGKKAVNYRAFVEKHP